MQGTDDLELVARIRHDDERAFEALFRIFYRPLYLVALGVVRDHTAAEDVAHEVLTDIWFRRARVEIRTTVRAYLYAAARKKAIDHTRRPRAKEVREGNLRFHPDFAPDRVVESPHAGLEHRELSPRLRQAVESLPPRQREIFTLRAGGDLSYAEIATVLETSVKNVEVQLRRAVLTLRQTLGAPESP